MEQKDYRLAAIMYTDISGFSRMMERDESGTLELLRFHNRLIGEIVERHHGTVIKTIGDALLVDFKNTVEALQSALEIQDQLYVHNKENPGLPLLVRIGLHLGDIYFFENDALGEGINIAARLQSLARPGCICFSQDVYNLVLNKLEFRAEKLGKVSLKNITKEIHAYEITTPNVEFDPSRDKPRPGYRPGSYLNGEEGAEELPVGGVAASQATATGPASPAWASTRPGPGVPAGSPGAPAGSTGGPATPPPAGKAAEADREYTEEGSRNVLAEIRRAILADTKAEGRRLSVSEARRRYGHYGVEAQEVIATMAEQGLLTRERAAPGPVFGAGSANSEIGRSIEAAVHGIVGEIERSVGRSMEYRGSEAARERMERVRDRIERKMERREIKIRLRDDEEGLETGKWDKELRDSEAWKPGEEELSRDFREYRDSVLKRTRRQRGGFVGNLVSFLGVNGFLWFLNLTTSPDFKWAAIVSASWGIGLLSSAAAAVRAGRKAEEIEAMPELDERQLATYKKLNRVRDSIVQHGVSTVTVPFLLGLINYLTGPEFLWFLIPAAAMGISFVSHLLAYGVTKPRLEKELKSSLGVSGSWRDAARKAKGAREAEESLGPYASLAREAERARSAILAQAGKSGDLDQDLGPSLEQYVGQVRLLARSANEIDRIVEAIPMADLAKDKAALVEREAKATGESLRAEYRKNIEEIDRQEKSYEELRNQSEVIRLRLGSSVNQLKQMQIDLARVKAAGEGGPGGMGQIRERTEELSRYLEDLRRGYDEAKRDPFEELARAEEERKAARKALEGPTEGETPGAGG